MLALPLFWLRAGAVAAVVIGLVWLVDEIGDRREAIVNARLTAARAADQAAAIERQRQSEKIAAQRQAELELERDQARIVADELQSSPPAAG